MLLSVAGAHPYNMHRLAEEPFWRVLYVYYRQLEQRARDALNDRLVRVDAALLASRAFHAPRSLDDERRAVERAIEDLDRDPADRATEVAAWRARGEALAARMERGRVLSPEALVA